MEEKSEICNSCAVANDDDIMTDKIKLLEISEAINELDSKLTDLEIALNINQR